MSDSTAATGDFDEYQIPLPASFQALYADARGRLLAPLAEVRARYEWCEDLAQLLAESLEQQPQDGWCDQQRLLRRCRCGLAGGADGADGTGSRRAGKEAMSSATPAAPAAPGKPAQTPAEADWIMQRTAEVLGWGGPAENAVTE